ncbi:MAG: redoxin domain-containing protein [Blastocatellia bacterium]|jgi:thiol-disulfide isomerase/thioredoxin|nr:redoxin domain-containing protein [Blastocatellia bacterium]MBL8192356.1 redoxin domain-containing protein [Blastocatellia bacterium]MBN8722021.1 redoxin domain-containing protein [Acidobacteriota bacterium]
MPMRIGTQLPSLEGATEWTNSNLEEVNSFIQGKPALIHFWAVSCGICKTNLPRIAEWRDKYKEDGLRIVAVHMPRYPEDQDLVAVREAIEKFGIVEPCAIDNLHKMRDAFQNDQGFVPAYYLFDQEGKLKSFAAGERGLDMLSSALNRVMTALKPAT